MMRQYLAIKAQHPDTLMFYRMGDFIYELFFARCRESRALARHHPDHTRTKCRPTDKMAGVPYHAAEQYLARLVKMGESVVICEQIGDPATSKGLVKRAVARIVTPGTITEAALLDDKQDSWFCWHCAPTKRWQGSRV